MGSRCSTMLSPKSASKEKGGSGGSGGGGGGGAARENEAAAAATTPASRRRRCMALAQEEEREEEREREKERGRRKGKNKLTSLLCFSFRQWHTATVPAPCVAPLAWSLQRDPGCESNARQKSCKGATGPAGPICTLATAAYKKCRCTLG